jgi:hypothetical protein
LESKRREVSAKKWPRECLRHWRIKGVARRTQSEQTKRIEPNEEYMKTNRIPLILRSSTLLWTTSISAAVMFVIGASAQNKQAGDDGIAASPKVRQMLNDRKASANPAPAQATTMSCPKCAEFLIVQPKRQAKGAEVLVGAKSTEMKHSCSGCEVKWTVVGEGKAKHSVAAHKCSADVPNNNTCCAK